MLMREPGLRIIRQHPEVSVLAEPPEYVTRAGSIVVVDLYEPVLVAGGVKDIPVGRELKGIAMKPVVRYRGQAEHRTTPACKHAGFFEQRFAIYIEMIKSIPRPLHLEIPVQHENHVSEHIHFV